MGRDRVLKVIAALNLQLRRTTSMNWALQMTDMITLSICVKSVRIADDLSVCSKLCVTHSILHQVVGLSSPRQDNQELLWTLQS